MLGPVIQKFVATLRFPMLFLLTAALLILTLLIPDPFPFADELLLAAITALLAALKRKDPPPDEEPPED